MTPGVESHDVDDAELLRRHVDGDTEAFGEIVRRHQERLWAVALRTLGDPDEAADALQDALVNAFRRASSFRAESAVTTWLHRIVVNACLDRVRHSAARPADPNPFDGGEITGAATPSGPDIAEQTTLRLDLEAALATLPPDQRVPLVLVDVEGYPVAEVAELLGLPVGTIKSRCARARARLLPMLAPGRRGTDPGNRLPAPDVRSGSISERGGDPR